MVLMKAEIHSLAFKITKEPKLSIFQFKLVHNILPHRILLHTMYAHLEDGDCRLP